ncbi:MAG: Aspartyl-tRNA(Asn) amidotransferase subunit B (EC @ Glutamyl-tRNA(Gln) amidotransferase subunit B (EC [uncultured Campylobacterales bacterium]|uniref:Aspartyl/glutamyl-tRNA(Asn/Gln) amidotransferase subunit B n=1 Tax=uncultured Campylobacterales bacterium TaxID=352960 RepID=A0A6S6S8I6_9BACT|nr:MAG: Aspartyl-tRNA(Asn) amidotransferase subunit B (EC @ Glutamyl-tRNA(Gln) amidotransferase subunit B (EC [uncultured Campylobacterales bacterium]
MFETIIGLEVHAQLNTKTKIFCNCATSFGDEPNTNVCPVCLGLPGALPVLNKDALEKSIAFGTAVNSKINDNSIFNRKNYFYPDLPKGYQISQFEVPIVEGGEIIINVDGQDKKIGITRAHLEEDAGKNNHFDSVSKVDLNRACTPLLEIVSEPDMRSSDEAIAYLKKLHQIVRFLDISDANMQEGSFRCDVNISIRPVGDTKLYTRVEIKNMNSFKFIASAIAYEVERQKEAWNNGTYEQDVYQETRLYDVNKNMTKSMRGKEDSADYRYLPEPDLRPVKIPKELWERAVQIPELPEAKKQRLIEDCKLKSDDVDIVVSSPEMAKYFEEMLKSGIKPANAIKWLNVELLARFEGEVNISNSPIKSSKLAILISKIEDNTISNKAAKEVLDYVYENTNIDIDTAIDKLGLKQMSDDSSIIAIIDTVLANNPKMIEQYKSGKDKLFGFFVGQVMKESKGSANPGVVNKLLKERL